MHGSIEIVRLGDLGEVRQEASVDIESGFVDGIENDQYSPFDFTDAYLEVGSEVFELELTEIGVYVLGDEDLSELRKVI